MLGNSDLAISPVSLGCWPMAGISSLGVEEKSSLATIEAAFAAGINHFDTAYSYGYAGESDRLLRHVLESRYDQVVIGCKVGTHYDSHRRRILDASPSRIRFETDEIRKRMALDRIDLLYLHTPDGVTPIEESAEALAELVSRGVVRHVGLSNASLDETMRFAQVVEPIVLQPPFNMLQPETLDGLRPYLESHLCGTACYWPLMKGLLAGAIQRDHVFDPGDKRLTYPIFQGEARQRAHNLLDVLRAMADELNWTVSQLVVHWTFRQPKVTTVLCGAKRPEQIIETAGAMHRSLSDAQLRVIDEAVVSNRVVSTS
jgi:aryl-alcohol dehydrogenase-like predicted oxidoreductase